MTRDAAPAHHGPGGRFRNPWAGTELHGLGGLVRWGLERLRHPPAADPDPGVFPMARSAFARPRAGEDRVTVTWIGHATALIQIGGRNVLTDPVFGERASPVRFAGPARWVAPGVALDALPPIDLVLVSHNHYDHLDVPSVRQLAARWPDARWVAPLGLRRWLERHGARRAVELDWWQEEDVDDLEVTATPAQHFSSRTPFDRNRTLWCGWAVAGRRRRVFVAGDSGYHPAFGAIATRLGPFDATLLPVGAYEPRWFMRPVHMNPEEAVRAFQDLDLPGANTVLVPVHWGTFKLTDEPMDEPPRRTVAAWRAAGLSEERLWLLRHGETRAIEPPATPSA
jgi:N-acyl-phosphatidylethanolamine-hydrolysing phospholipase D